MRYGREYGMQRGSARPRATGRPRYDRYDAGWGGQSGGGYRAGTYGGYGSDPGLARSWWGGGWEGWRSRGNDYDRNYRTGAGYGGYGRAYGPGHGGRGSWESDAYDAAYRRFGRW